MSIQRFVIIIFISTILVACSDDATPDPVMTAEVTSIIPPIEATILPSPISEPSPANTPIPRVECPDAPPTRLIIQDRGRVTDDNSDTLNLRAGAGTDFDVIARLEPLDMFLVLEGPVCADGFAWFRVRAGTRIGWIAEGDSDLYYAEPHLTG